MINTAILIGTKVVKTDGLSWAKWFEEKKNNRIVGRTDIGPFRVSTVFLGLDHGFVDKPLWFETMVFGIDFGIDGGQADPGGWIVGRQVRYETYEQARRGHELTVSLVRNYLHTEDEPWVL